ncbi:PREDICTED: coiled-coil domain-containing protein 93 isoform X2 [Nicotiana attenuata]|uniref:coiled-coil domain-containing protein 93 isoform X2 n=1 Tax=Nicotiana attenuata TaxID=49451 RepID=UPI0009049881|nr:PREDICTED: coiled-coil domain-containing protein 93 isoform X2 [Nicotiana attenuata]
MEEVKKDDNLKLVQERIERDPAAHRILSSKAQESELQCDHATLQTKVDEFDQLLQRGKEGNLLDHTFRDSSEKLHSAKRELAAKLRSTLSLKRLLEYVPSQAELIQYELRFSELYTDIQAKHRQTHKYYATYNILLEIKELMLKETSLLNSISSQKLEKVQIALQSEQKVREALKGKHAAAVSEQRHYNSILKAFQVECARNERLREQNSQEHLPS